MIKFNAMNNRNTSIMLFILLLHDLDTAFNVLLFIKFENMLDPFILKYNIYIIK